MGILVEFQNMHITPNSKCKNSTMTTKKKRNERTFKNHCFKRKMIRLFFTYKFVVLARVQNNEEVSNSNR